MIRSRGLSHIQIAVRDVNRSVRFYQGVLGLQEKFKSTGSFVFLHTPGANDIVTLRHSTDPSERVGETGGIAHFDFHLEDLSDFEQSLVAAAQLGGSVVRRGVRTTDACPAEPWAFVKDPDGYVIELYSPTITESPDTDGDRGTSAA